MTKNSNPPHEDAEYIDAFWDQVCNDEYISRNFEDDNPDFIADELDHHEEVYRNPTIDNLDDFFDSNEN